MTPAYVFPPELISSSYSVWPNPVDNRLQDSKSNRTNQRTVQSCDAKLALEEKTRKAIGKVVSTLENIRKLKGEQEYFLVSFMIGKDVVALLPTGFGKSLIYRMLTKRC